MGERILEITARRELFTTWPDLETSLFFEEGLDVDTPKEHQSCKSISHVNQ